MFFMHGLTYYNIENISRFLFFEGGVGEVMRNIRPNICVTQNAICSYKNSFLENLNVRFYEKYLNEESLSEIRLWRGSGE